MPRKPTGRPSGRPKREVPADAHAYVRMTSADRVLIERACELMAKADPMAPKPSVAAWLLRAGVLEARRRLGEK